MDLLDSFALITDGGQSLPICLLPMFTVGTPIDGASISPLEELPTTTSAYLKRFKYIKRLLRKYYDTEILKERLLLNHIIVLNNVFGADACATLLLYKIQEEYWPALKSFLLFLNIIKEDELEHIEKDERVYKVLKEL